MDSLKQYFEIQRKDNEILRQEIITKLDNLFSPVETAAYSSNRSPTKYCNYITELCHFEQKINHKLTEINFELRKFILQNKCPEVEPPPIKNEQLIDSLDDIETLKANSSKLVLKLDKLRSQQFKETKLILKNEPEVDAKIHLKNVEDIPLLQNEPLISFDTCSTDKSVENLIVESKLLDLDENIDNIGLTSIGNSGTRKLYKGNSINPPVGELQDNLILGCQTEEICKNKFKDEPFQLSAESSISKTEIVTKKDQNLMDESIDLNLSNLKEAGQYNGKLSPSFDNKDIVMEVMWKNLTELSISKSTNPGHSLKVEINDDLFNFSHEKMVQLQDVREPKTESKEKKDCLLQLDTDSSSYYDSESDIDSNPSEDLLVDIPKFDMKTNLNLCDSIKQDYLNGLKLKKRKNNTNSAIEESKENVEDTKNSQAFSRSVLDKQQVYKKENLRHELEKSSGDSNDALIPSELKSETVKPVFSAEEKIKKLGLEDRRTIFENSKKTAVLPDLRLRPSRPSVTDTEKKLEHKKNRENKFEIAESVAPKVNTNCVFSHIESPSDFYIHPDTEESKLIDSLNDLITEKYKKTKSPFLSKDEACKNIGRYCCAYVKEDNMYYRAEVVDWLIDESEKLVWIILVDYGNGVYVHFKNLRMLTQQFCLLPKLAVRCYLPLLYPPGSTKNDILDEWPKESAEAFFELSGLNVENNSALFKIVYVEDERNGIGIDLYQVNGQDGITIGELLIDLGHAVQIVLEEDDPMGILTDEDDIENWEKCSNINEVILGYDPKDEARICKFTKHDGGQCFKRNCKLEHTKFTRGGFTTDKTLTYIDALKDLNMPKPNDEIQIRFTTVVSATCFYMNIIRNANLKELEYTINNPTNCSNYERFKIMPAHGEVVLVNHWQKRWLRGKVRHHLFSENGKCTGVQVFMVDYGDIIDVGIDNIRQIKKEYLNLPFQAVECVLHNYENSGEYGQKDMDRFFYENMVFREFKAKVLAVSDTNICAEVYHKNRNMGDILVDYGFLKKVDNKILFPHPNSVIIPG